VPTSFGWRLNLISRLNDFGLLSRALTWLAHLNPSPSGMASFDVIRTALPSRFSKVFCAPIGAHRKSLDDFYADLV
jgi:hypothetical protein